MAAAENEPHRRVTGEEAAEQPTKAESPPAPAEGSGPPWGGAGEVSRGGAWRAEVAARVRELEDRLAAICDEPGKPSICQEAESDAKVRRTVTKRIQAELKAAVDAANEGHRLFTTKSTQTAGRWYLKAWWTGESVTKAWEAVHNAEFALLQLESDEAVRVSAPRLLSWVERVMDSGTERKDHERALETEIEPKDPKTPVDRVKVRGALADAIAANGRRYAAVRNFRNNLILATGLLAILLVAVAVWHDHNVSFLSLCGSEGKKGGLGKCLGGTQKDGPFSAEIWLVLLMGALGGALGLVFKLSEADDPTRFNPKWWQRLLKPVTGAATALAAILLLQSHQIVELTTENQTRVTYLTYAFIFGFSQQVLTKFVDERAENLVKPKS
jgi:hypothetical protein